MINAIDRETPLQKNKKTQHLFETGHPTNLTQYTFHLNQCFVTKNERKDNIHVIDEGSCTRADRCCRVGFVPFGKGRRIFLSVSWRAGGSLNRPCMRVCGMGPHRVMGNGVINNTDLP